jgi:hypothetical protein
MYWLTQSVTFTDRAGLVTNYMYNEYTPITDIRRTRIYRQYFAQWLSYRLRNTVSF